MKKKADVVYWLDRCLNSNSCIGCPWERYDGCFDRLVRDALAIMMAETDIRVQEVMGDEKQT